MPDPDFKDAGVFYQQLIAFAFGAFFDGAKNAAAPNLTGKEGLLAGTALLFSTRFLLMAIGSALGGWAATVLVGCELWYAIEPLALRRLAGCRAPTHAERELLDQAVTIAHLQPLIVETPGLVIGRAVRTLVVGRDVLEVADERALVGLLHQTCATVHRA